MPIELDMALRVMEASHGVEYTDGHFAVACAHAVGVEECYVTESALGETIVWQAVHWGIETVAWVEVFIVEGNQT